MRRKTAEPPEWKKNKQKQKCRAVTTMCDDNIPKAGGPLKQNYCFKGCVVHGNAEVTSMNKVY
jgi:hypothetical protein